LGGGRRGRTEEMVEDIGKEGKNRRRGMWEEKEENRRREEYNII
jgi:hypothetical protein